MKHRKVTVLGWRYSGDKRIDYPGRLIRIDRQNHKAVVCIDNSEAVSVPLGNVQFSRGRIYATANR